MDEFEYCVMRSDLPQEPHRGPMTREEAVEWVREAIVETECPESWFYVARRKIGPWERQDA